MPSQYAWIKILQTGMKSSVSNPVLFAIQNAEAAARDEVQKVLNMADEYKKRWNNSWEEQERRLQQNLQICQFNFDLRQVTV